MAPPPQNLGVQPVWVSTSSGQVTPVGPGSCTPIQLYAVPVVAGTVSPGPLQGAYAAPMMATIVGNQPAACVNMGGVYSPTFLHDGSSNSENVTPSDTSFREHLLPMSLFGSTGGSDAGSLVSDAVSPDCRHASTDSAATSVAVAAAAARLHGKDDRWVCIPSGVVERRKTQFESRGSQEFEADQVMPSELDDGGLMEAHVAVTVPGGPGITTEWSLDEARRRHAGYLDAEA